MACEDSWPLREKIPDLLARIPNFEQERCFVVRHGDKKDMCDEINGARWMADFGLTTDNFDVAQEALDALCKSLTTHVRKPHIHFVEASEMVEKLIVSNYVGFTMTELALIEKEVVIKQAKVQPKPTSDPFKQSSKLATKIIRSHVNGQNVNIEENSENSQEAMQQEENLPSASKLIKAFQEPKEKSSSPALPARERSPTLRLFSSTDSGQGKKSVLKRFDDSKLKAKAVSSQALQEAKKAKRGIVESMRQNPTKDRMAAFQPHLKKVLLIF